MVSDGMDVIFNDLQLGEATPEAQLAEGLGSEWPVSGVNIEADRGSIVHASPRLH